MKDSHLLEILNDRLDRLSRHGRFEEAEILRAALEQLFPSGEAAKASRESGGWG
jgi:hypothetical protein